MYYAKSTGNRNWGRLNIEPTDNRNKEGSILNPQKTEKRSLKTETIGDRHWGMFGAKLHMLLNKVRKFITINYNWCKR